MSGDSASEVVLSERRGAVLLLTLNRPDRLNAWNEALEAAYFDQLDAADADPEVRAVVVTGAGRGISAGADMEVLEQVTDGAEAGTGSEAATELVERPRPRSHPMNLRKPLIGAVNGAAAGLGFVEAMYCDVRFSVPAAKFTTAFVHRGLIAEYGIAWILPRLVGTSRALDLLMSGRIVLGEEAHRIGLVDRLCEPESLVEDAVAYATELAERSSPTSMAVMKAQVQRGLEQSFDQAYADAERLMGESFQRPDVAEGVKSYLEKRPPAFPPL